MRGETGLVHDDAALAVDLKTRGGVLDERVRRGAERHDDAVDRQIVFAADLFDRAAAAGGVRLAQLHLHAGHGGDIALLVAVDLDGVIERLEDDALFDGMLDLFVTGRQFFHAAAVDDVHVSAQTLGAARSVHGDVAAADDGDFLALKRHDGRVGAVLISLHQVDTGQELVGGVNAAEVLAGDVHEHRKTCAGADEHGLEAVLAHQLVDGHDAADDHVRFDLDTEGLQTVDFLLHDGLGKSELGDAVDQHAAGEVERFKNGDIVALLGKVTRAGETAGAGTDDRDLVAVGRGLGGRFLHICIVPVGDKALEAADADGLALDAAHALRFALRLLRADAAADGGQGGGLMNDLIGALIVLFGDLLDEFGDLDLHRAAGDAGMVLAV